MGDLSLLRSRGASSRSGSVHCRRVGSRDLGSVGKTEELRRPPTSRSDVLMDSVTRKMRRGSGGSGLKVRCGGNEPSLALPCHKGADRGLAAGLQLTCSAVKRCIRTSSIEIRSSFSEGNLHSRRIYAWIPHSCAKVSCMFSDQLRCSVPNLTPTFESSPAS